MLHPHLVRAAAVLSSGLATASFAQVEQYDIIKAQLYEQSSGQPSRYLVGFGARISEASPGGIGAATLTAPGGQVMPLTVQEQVYWRHEPVFDSVDEMDAALPAGSYSLAISGGSLGSQSESLTLPPTIFPPVPEVLNWEALQHIDPTQDFRKVDRAGY